MEKICQHCGQSFEPKRADGIYCGNSCRQLAYIERKSAEDNNNPENLGVMSLYEEDEPEQGQSSSDSRGSSEKEKPTKSLTKRFGEISNPQTDLPINPTNQEIKFYSRFLDKLEYEIEHRGKELPLAEYHFYRPENAKWVYTHHLFIIDSLLNLCERKSVELDELIMLCDCLYLLLDSDNYKLLPSSYPYFKENDELFTILSSFCEHSQHKKVRIKINRKTKIELIATRYELNGLVPLIKFKQLKFE